jgi:hypothetical protein
MYAVHGIDVDATAGNASDAREKAIAQGARKGLEQLLRDLTLPENAKSLPAVSEKSASALVIDFEVESERASATRYIAKLSFRYRPEGVRALLAGVGGHYVGAQAPLVLIVPVYRAAGGDLLWQPENPWRTAWKNGAANAALVPVVVPEGSPDDAASLDVSDLQDQAKLTALAERYKAENALVVVATATSPTGEPGAGLDLVLSGTGTGSQTIHSDGAASPADALNKGVAATLAALDSMWKQHVLKGTPGVVGFKASQTPQVDAGDMTTHAVGGSQYAVRAELHGPGDFAALRTKLSQTDGILRVQLKSLTRDEAVLVLNVVGSDDQLSQTLSKAGLSVGTPEAVPVGDSELATMVPASGPGAGLIYPITSTESP